MARTGWRRGEQVEPLELLLVACRVGAAGEHSEAGERVEEGRAPEAMTQVVNCYLLVRHTQPVSSFRCISVSGWHGLVHITVPGEALSGGYSSPQKGRGRSPSAQEVSPPQPPASADTAHPLGRDLLDQQLSDRLAFGQRRLSPCFIEYCLLLHVCLSPLSPLLALRAGGWRRSRIVGPLGTERCSMYRYVA